jgi:hypothetical protein
MKFDIGFPYKLSRLHDLREKQCSENRTSLRGINGCLPVINTFLERVGLIHL